MARKGINWEVELENLLHLSEGGASLTDIANDYKVSVARISQVFKKYGLKVTFEHRGRPRGAYN